MSKGQAKRGSQKDIQLLFNVPKNKSYLEKNKKDTVMCSFDESLSETNPDYHTILCFKMDPSSFILFCVLFNKPH